jgi:hypothetical protein
MVNSNDCSEKWIPCKETKTLKKAKLKDLAGSVSLRLSMPR